MINKQKISILSKNKNFSSFCLIMFWPKLIYQADKSYLAILQRNINLTLLLIRKKTSTRSYHRQINTDKVNRYS